MYTYIVPFLTAEAILYTSTVFDKSINVYVQITTHRKYIKHVKV